MSDAAADAHLAREALDRLLETDAPALRAALPPGFADRAEAYVRLLLEANERQNLTRLVEPEDVARLHLLDALAALPLIGRLEVRRALDLGSGGGVPGLVLALARPDLEWTLVDAVGRKADALRAFVGALGLSGVTVLAERAETLGRGPLRESVDLVVARACAPLPVLVEYALPVLRVGGTLVAWKGRVSEAELGGGTLAAAQLGGGPAAIHATGIDRLGDHSFVVIRKQRPTPQRFPRRPGVPARRPLA